MKRFFFRIIADLRFSIFIILLISLSSIIGTIIEQDQLIEVYKLNYPLTNPILGFLSWDFILKTGLDHIYRTWWFFLLIFSFAISLTICSFIQQLPSLKVARRCQFFRIFHQFYRLKLFITKLNISFTDIFLRLQKKNFSIFQQKNILYCYKGLIGKVTPLVVHFSMLFVLFGTIIGSFFGLKSQELVPKTEIFSIQNLLNVDNIALVPKVSTRINDFWINYTSEKKVLQFYSDLSILDIYGNEIIQKTVCVNSPLVYNQIYFYQTDWELNGIRFEDKKKNIFEYPLVNVFDSQKRIWLTWISNQQLFNNKLILLFDNLQGYCSIYNENGIFIKNMELNEFYQNTKILDILVSTGLQIKTDPGIPLIYFGFFILILSVFLSYLTYSQIWIVQEDNKTFIGGTTTRALFNFELEFLKIINKRN